MIDLISYQGDFYPAFQAKGNASQFALSFARHVCSGVGYDIGYGEEDWKFPGAIGIDIKNKDGYHANNLPVGQVDFIYSSHCLEHLDDWVETLEYWISKLKIGGVLFLYLPHEAQKYWLPWNNRKHKHILSAKHIAQCMERFGMVNIFHGERDLNHSFMIFGEKSYGVT